MTIAVNHLEFGFSQPLQDPLTIEVTGSQVVAVVGPNGSGKTTLFNTILGIVPAISGDVHIQGRLGALFQDRSLPLSIPMNRWINHLARLWAIDVNHELLEQLNLPIEKTIIRRLSGGSAQKLALYSALHHRPTVAILDEPTNNLDAPSRERMYDIVNGMKNTGTAFLISSHQASDIAALNAHVINFASNDDLGRSALVTFSGAVTLTELPVGVRATQTATGVLISSRANVDFMQVAVDVAHKNDVTITSFQVMS